MKSSINIINTGGTFNKAYNPLSGQLQVSKNHDALEDILGHIYKTNVKPKVESILYKDSLDIDDSDRKIMLKKIKKTKEKSIIIIHGTDTMNKTAKYLNKRVKNKKIVIVGAMQPYSYEKVESSASLAMAIGFLSSKVKNNIYICMNGMVKKHNKIKKNYKLGVFECQ